MATVYLIPWYVNKSLVCVLLETFCEWSDIFVNDFILFLLQIDKYCYEGKITFCVFKELKRI